MIQDCTEIERQILRDGHCPDCGHSDFLRGPQGGDCTNIKCAHCGEMFNVGPLTAQRIKCERSEH